MRSIPGLARGVQDAALGCLDAWLTPHEALRRLGAGILRVPAYDVATLSPETVRWSPASMIQIVWLGTLRSGAVFRAHERIFASPQEAAAREDLLRSRATDENDHFRACARVADGRSLWTAFPHDPDLPGLAEAMRPAALRNALTQTCEELRLARARVVGRSTRTEVVRYTPGSRCVLRVEASLATTEGDDRAPLRIFISILPAAPADGVVAAAQRIHFNGAPVAFACGYDPELSAYVEREVDGTPMTLRSMDGALHRRVGAQLAALHRADASGLPRGESLTERTAHLAAVAHQARTVLEAAGLGGLVAAAQRIADAPTRERAAVPVHGDLHLGHCVATGNDLTFVHTDALRATAPERDAGRFLGMLRARAVVDRWTPTEWVAASAGFRECAGDLDADALALEQAAALLECALAPVRSLAAGCFDTARNIFAAAAEILPAPARRGVHASAAPQAAGAPPRLAAVQDAFPQWGALRDAAVVGGCAGDDGTMELQLRVMQGDGVTRTVYARCDGARLTALASPRPLDAPLLRSLASSALRCPRPALEDVRAVPIGDSHGTCAAYRLDVTTIRGAEQRLVLRRVPTRPALARAEWAMRARAAAGEELAFAAPLLVDEDSATAIYPFVDGMSVEAAFEAGDAVDAKAIVRALRSLHATAPPANVDAFRPDEAAEDLRRDAANRERAGVPVPASFAGAADALASAAGSLESSVSTLLHGALRESRMILVGDGSARLIDLNHLVSGPPALDFGAVAACIERRAAVGAFGERERELHAAVAAAAGAQRRWFAFGTAARLLRFALHESFRAWIAGAADPDDRAGALCRRAVELLASGAGRTASIRVAPLRTARTGGA